MLMWRSRRAETQSSGQRQDAPATLQKKLNGKLAGLPAIHLAG
jgi:hypothetical protein